MYKNHYKITYWIVIHKLLNIVKVVASPSNKWYLDHVDNTWEVMYAYDPADNITDSDEKAFLLGGIILNIWYMSRYV
jgi:hypothetical protein